MIFLWSFTVGALTVIFINNVRFWENTLAIIESVKNIQSIFNASISDDLKQEELLKNSKLQFWLSIKLLVQTIVICIPGVLFFFFFYVELFQKNNLLLTSLISSASAFFTFKLFKKSEK